MKYLGYASPMLSFAAVVAALLGPIRNDDESGLAAITLFGWTLIAIAALSLVVSVLRARQREAEAGEARAAAAAYEAKVNSMARAANRLLKPGLDRLRRVLDFVFLISQLEDPGDPRSLRPPADADQLPDQPMPKGPYDDLAMRLRSLPFDHSLRIDGLKRFNHLPRTHFDIDYETRMLTRREDVLIPEDPHGTGIPFAVDERPFPDIVTEEFGRAAEALTEAIKQPGYDAIDPEVLELANHVLDHRLMRAAAKFSGEIERFLRLEDYNDTTEDGSNPERGGMWDHVHVSFIIDSGISIGTYEDDYLDFARTLAALDNKVGD